MTRSRKRKLIRKRMLWSGIPFASTLLAAQPAAMAQQQEESRALEEVVVTAQKRSENLQNVPLSITAIGTKKLEELNVASFGDYAKFLPSLSFQNGGQSGGPGFSRAYMRGVASGGDGNHSGSLPSVGTYLDEQPVTTINGALDVHIYDIARVEALAGPQGTLYGASSQSGTIRIITNKPDATGFYAGYNLDGSTVADGETGYLAEGFVNLPISDRAAIRLVGWARHDPGFIDNVPGSITYPTSGITIRNTSRNEDYNAGDVYGARAALKIDLNDTWTVTPTLMGQKHEREGSYGYSTSSDLELTRYNPETSRDRWLQASLTVEGKFTNFDLVYAGALMRRNDETQQDYADYSFFYDDCCGYGSYVVDNTGNLIDPTQYIRGKDRYKKQSHELRIASPQDRRLRFVGGLFAQRQTHDIEQDYLIRNLATSLWVTGWPDTWWLTQQVRTDRDYAAFGEISYDLTEQLTATGGIRLFKSKNSLKGFFGFGLNNPFFPVLGEPVCFSRESVNGAPCTNLDKQVDETGNTPKINLTYRFDDQRMVYVTFSEGFRPGGVNRRGTLPPYRADFLTNYEIGWKTSWAANRLRLNGAVFVEDWEDFQFSFLGQNSLTQIANAGNARIKGVEMDVHWAATADLSFSGGFALLDAALTQAYCGTLGADGRDLNPCPTTPDAPNGTQLPVTPKFKGNVTARYEFNVGGFEAHLQGAVAYIGDRWPELRTARRVILGKVPGYTLTDISAGIENQSYSLELYVANAFDKRAQLDRWAQCDATICGNAGTYITPAQPRTIGIKFGQKF